MQIDPQRLKENFIDLVKLNSPSGQEKIVSDWLKIKFSQLGLTVKEDESRSQTGSDSGNIIVRIPGTLPGDPIFMAAHLDVVAEMDNPTIIFENDTFCTDGTTILGADDKAGVAALLELATVLVTKQIPHLSLELVFTVCEEIGLLGAKALDLKLLSAKQGFVFDSSKPFGSIITQSPYKENFRCIVQGKAAHAGIRPEAGVNAVQVAARAIDQMPQGRLSPATTCNLGGISGGSATNIVPDKVEVWGEVRSLEPEELAAQKEKVNESFQKAAASFGGKVECSWEERYSGFKLADDAEVVKKAQEAMAAIGTEGVLMATGGGSDANVFNGRGLETVNFGIGCENSHSPQETITLTDLCGLAKLGLALATKG